MRLCTVGGALRHLELAPSIYTLSLSVDKGKNKQLPCELVSVHPTDI